MRIENNIKDNLLDDIIILRDILLSEKYLSYIYHEALNSFSNNELYKDFKNFNNEIESIIGKINNLIFSLGYSSLIVCDEDNVKKLLVNKNKIC